MAVLKNNSPTLKPPGGGGGGHSLICAIKVRAARKGMVFQPFWS